MASDRTCNELPQIIQEDNYMPDNFVKTANYVSTTFVNWQQYVSQIKNNLDNW